MKYIVCYWKRQLSIPLDKEIAIQYASELAAKNLEDFPDPTKFNVVSIMELR